MTDALGIAEKHLDRIADERKERSRIIKEHYPEMHDFVMERFREMGGRMVGIESDRLNWGDMGKDGVPADVYLANSEAEKEFRAAKAKKEKRNA